MTVKFSDFKKLELRTGKVIEEEEVTGTKKLIKLIVDSGKEKRTLVAGLQGYYSPEQLIGKTIIVLANLEPKRIRGIESQGMLLAAIENGKPVLLTTDKPVSPGCPVE